MTGSTASAYIALSANPLVFVGTREVRAERTAQWGSTRVRFNFGNRERVRLPARLSRHPPEKTGVRPKFFDRGAAVAGTGNYDYAIEMFLQGFALDPDAVDAHQTLRDISLKRKASGGKPIGMFEAMKLKRSSKDEKQNMLNAEKLLAHDPGNTDHMLSLIDRRPRSRLLGYGHVDRPDPSESRMPIRRRKPEYNKFLVPEGHLRSIGQWQLAAEACQYAVMLRPDDMDLATELKNLGAQETMTEGKYGEAASFRESVKDMDAQKASAGSRL